MMIPSFKVQGGIHWPFATSLGFLHSVWSWAWVGRIVGKKEDRDRINSSFLTWCVSEGVVEAASASAFTVKVL